MRIIIGLSILALSLGAVQAQESGTPDEFATVRSAMTLLQIGSDGITQEEILARLTKPIRQFDRDGDGLDLADAARQVRIEKAAVRSSTLAPLLQLDLDGDRTVTGAELAEALAYPSVFGRSARGSEQLFTARDANKDGDLTWDELMLLDEQQTESIRRMGIEQFLESVSVFTSKYGDRFTLDDAGALAPVIIRLLDTDGNGLATIGEIQALQVTAGRPPAEEPVPASCEMPDVPTGAKVLLVGAYEGLRYASANFGDITEDTGFADVKVEEGDTLLYVVLSAYSPIVWNFAGHIDRVAKVIVSGYRLGGVVGIEADKVTFLEGRDCITRAYDFASVDGFRAKGQVHNLLGAEVAAGGSYGLGEIAIPSMTVDATNESSGRDRQAVTVDPATVVDNTKVSTFEVLPGYAGISQLLDNGSLEAVGGGYRIVSRSRTIPPACTAGIRCSSS